MLHALRRAVGAAAVAAVAVIAPAAPAEALVVPAMSLSITPFATYHRVCATGTAAAALYTVGDWELAIDGTRATGLPIVQSASATARTFSVCQDVPKFASPQGQYWVTFAFAGVGSDVAGKMTGYAAWQPALADISFVFPA